MRTLHLFRRQPVAILATALALALSSVGCSGSESPPVTTDVGPEPDRTPPTVEFTFPALSGFTQHGTFTFRGVAGDDVALASVEVDGQPVTTTDGYASWTIAVG